MQNFVGVMDSGIGGLTVLQQLRKVAPQCNFVYVADGAFCPYGVRTSGEIRRRTFAVARALHNMGATQIVVACNTASVFADDLRAELSLPICDVIAPTCEQVVASGAETVALLATDFTVKSGVYQRILQKSGVEVLGFLCSPLVSLVENGASRRKRQRVLFSCLSALPYCKADTVVLGCTHFPLLRDEIASFAPHGKIVSCDEPVAQQFCVAGGCGETAYYTTGKPERIMRAAAHFGVRFSHVKI